jgi:RND family efflux transporter MFP subunit
LKAPFAGVLAQVPVERGAYVPPGGTIARLLQVDPIVVSVSVSDRDVGGLKVGGRAVISTSGSPNPREGKISFIAPASDLKTRTFRVEVELENESQSIRPGMIASVQFVSDGAEEQLIIPQDFLVTKIEENGVFVVDSEQVARWRPVKLGELLRDQVVVLEGLLDGDEIVVVGHRSLVDGDRLLVGRRGACCEEGRIVYGSRNKDAVESQPASAPETEESTR